MRGPNNPAAAAVLSTYSEKIVPLLVTLFWQQTSGLSIVIPTYNRIKMLKNTLAGLLIQEDFNRHFEVILVDNGSDIPIRSHINEFRKYLDVKIISRFVNINFLPGTARNIGVLNSLYDNIVFLDSDCIPSRHFLVNHWNVISSPNGKVASIGHRVFVDSKDLNVRLIMASDFSKFDFKIVQSESNYMERDDRRLPELVELEYHPAPYNCFHGCNIGLKRQHFLEVGMFDPIFDGYWGYEDIDLGHRLFRLGLKLVYIPDAFVYHQEGEGLKLDERLFGRDRNFQIACNRIQHFECFRKDLGR